MFDRVNSAPRRFGKSLRLLLEERTLAIPSSSPLFNGNAHFVRAKVAQTENAISVGHADKAHVFDWPVPLHLLRVLSSRQAPRSRSDGSTPTRECFQYSCGRIGKSRTRAPLG